MAAQWSLTTTNACNYITSRHATNLTGPILQEIDWKPSQGQAVLQQLHPAGTNHAKCFEGGKIQPKGVLELTPCERCTPREGSKYGCGPFRTCKTFRAPDGTSIMECGNCRWQHKVCEKRRGGKAGGGESCGGKTQAGGSADAADTTATANPASAAA